MTIIQIVHDDSTMRTMDRLLAANIKTALYRWKRGVGDHWPERRTNEEQVEWIRHNAGCLRASNANHQ